MTATSTRLKAVAFGGGVQSTSLLVLAAQRRIDFDVFLFANVGDDSEDPRTLDYLHRYAKPYAAAHGIELVELHRDRRDGTRETLYGRLIREGSRSLPIPVRMSGGAPGTRSCTADFKVRLIGRWLKQHGATTATPATLGIGISLDEVHRVNARRALPYEQAVYPLLDHAPPLRRIDCQRIIVAAGLPVPSKSACPLKRPSAFGEMRRDRPDLFARACALETFAQRAARGAGQRPGVADPVQPALAEAVGRAQDVLPGLDVNPGVGVVVDGDSHCDDDAGCDNGACFT